MSWIVTLITTLLGWLPEKVYDHISDHFANQKKVEREFTEIYVTMRSAFEVRQIDAQLKRLRDFFHSEHKLLDERMVGAFYLKWLKAREIAIEYQGDDNFWTQALYEELLEDMEKIKSLI